MKNPEKDGWYIVTYFGEEIECLYTKGKWWERIGNSLHVVDVKITDWKTTNEGHDKTICKEKCINRGKVNGLSQETFCSQCVRGDSWKEDFYDEGEWNGRI